jgi:hypothetical protein
MSDSVKRLRIQSVGDDSAIANLAPSIGESGWIILESYASLIFKAWSRFEPLPPLGGEFAGRIFGPDAEIRWYRDPSGFQGWHYSETQQGDAFRAVRRMYYCQGYWANGRFWEPSLPQAIPYPCSAANEKDRPRFHAVEYYRLPPETWPEDPDEVEVLLNQPLLAAYRLFSFDAGKDSDNDAA